MAFLDFLKQRQASGQQADAPKPQTETAKQMYTREAAQRAAAVKPITPEIKQEAERAMTMLSKASQHASSSRTVAPEAAGGAAAQRQNQQVQGNAQPALSPTDGMKGKTVGQDEVRPLPTPKREQPTVVRRPPSWER